MRIRSGIATLFGVVCLLMGGATLASDDRPAIHVAADRNDIAFVRDWIRKARNVDHEYNDRSFTLHGGGARVRKLTPLMVAAERRNFEVVRLLVEAGADIYRESTRADGHGEGKTVFEYAVEGGDVRVVRYLWSVSDGKRMLKHLSRTFLVAFDRSCYGFPNRGRQELLEFLLTTFDRTHASEALWRISDRQACAPAIHFILDHAVAPGSGALVTAAALGLTDIVALYLTRGANVNAYGHSSYTYLQAKVTPLIASAGRVRLETMRFLLKEGADPNLQDSQGRTALVAIISESACSREVPACANQIDGIKLLLQRGARIDIADRQGRTAMDYLDRYPGDPYKATKRELLVGSAR